MSALYLGALSGTSMNSIDAALFDFASEQPQPLARHAADFPDLLREKLQHLALNPHSLKEYAMAEYALSQCFAECIQALLESADVEPAQIAAAGIHGQTLLHQPTEEPPLTLQLLNPSLISAQCGIPVISDFRRRDLAEGGEGAPLAPLAHQRLFHSATENRAVVNIGGIANITWLPADGPARGHDSGPGGCLLDEWSQLHLGEDYDEDGQWGRTGEIQEKLLQAMLKDPYFELSPPKSTSREYFCRDWLEGLITDHPASPVDIQATLTELTARTLAMALQADPLAVQTVLLCGGGARNTFLRERLAEQVSMPVELTDAHGLEAEWVECFLFALLACLVRPQGSRRPDGSHGQQESYRAGSGLAGLRISFTGRTRIRSHRWSWRWGSGLRTVRLPDLRCSRSRPRPGTGNSSGRSEA